MPPIWLTPLRSVDAPNLQSSDHATRHRWRGYSNVVPTTSNDPTQSLATRIKGERDARGWTLAELAERSGVSRAMIAKVEAGKSSPTAMLLGTLSGAFGITISTLLARAEDANRSRVLRHDQRLVWRDPQSGYVRRQVFPIPGST